MKKRIISMLLAIFMVVGMLPTVVFAADVVAGGTCGASGASVNWVLDSDGVLTISGEGKMTNYNLGNSKAPWSDYKSSLKKVVIESGVTMQSTAKIFTPDFFAALRVSENVGSVAKLGPKCLMPFI